MYAEQQPAMRRAELNLCTYRTLSRLRLTWMLTATTLLQAAAARVALPEMPAAAVAALPRHLDLAIAAAAAARMTTLTRPRRS
ncbi:hypothetical protein COO60DRAFT_518698 [Scenedesmus sp. NREL 46B-D3]|nr:hypothetical protein COO60DRAFT_518698 [Scenedesmus sp. NREL 46B-D3]